jgi:hypothetical protein
MASKRRVWAEKEPYRIVPRVPGVAEWENFKGNCRNLPPQDAVNECAWLSDQFRTGHRSMAPVQPDFREIVATLQGRKIPFVLTGAHGISTWTGRPRSTHDVDIIVKAGRNHARAVKSLQALYPVLEVRSFTGLTAFFVPGERESVIDVMMPYRADIEVTLATGVWIEDKGLRYRIPALEAALANKYGAMLAPNRDPAKRMIDAVDFTHMVRHSTDEGRDPIDLDALAALGELVWPGGGGAEILRLVAQVKAGQVPVPDAAKPPYGVSPSAARRPNNRAPRP